MDLCPLLSGKGYFLGVLMTATFATMHIFAQKNSGNWMIFLPTLPVSCVNHYRSLVYRCFKRTINAYEMVIYPIAFFVCLFGQCVCFARHEQHKALTHSGMKEYCDGQQNINLFSGIQYCVMIALVGGIVTYLLGL